LTSVILYDNILIGKEVQLIKVKIKPLMDARNWDAKDLAYHADIGMATVYRLLRDSEYDETDADAKAGPGIVVLKRVARALGVKVTDLIEEDRHTRHAALAGTAHSMAG
jgi:hypothetical protein